MADNDSSAGVVAVLVIFVVVIVGGLLAYRSGMLGEGGAKDVNIHVEAPIKSAPSAPKAP